MEGKSAAEASAVVALLERPPFIPFRDASQVLPPPPLHSRVSCQAWLFATSPECWGGHTACAPARNPRKIYIRTHTTKCSWGQGVARMLCCPVKKKTSEPRIWH